MNERGIVSKAEHKKKEKMDLFRQEEKAHINVWETKALDSVYKTLLFHKLECFIEISTTEKNCIWYT